MGKTYIDINCDVGEGIGNEAQLFQYISSCNIACGGHAGDKDTIAKVVRLAKENNIRIGAHPSYPDRKNFGRISVKIPADKLIASIRSQIALLTSVLKKEEIHLHHIKPHGALYNDIAVDGILAKTFLESIKKYRDDTIVYMPYASVIAKEALSQGFKIAYEAFGDRNYNNDLTLVSRTRSNAIISEPEAVLQHIVLMIVRKKVRTAEGSRVPILADTYCIHGDTPSALQILMYLSKELPSHNIYLKK